MTGCVVAIGWFRVSGKALEIADGAATTRNNRNRTIAVVEVTDLIRESDIVRMSCPRYAGLLRRGVIHRMKIKGDILAGRAIGIELHLTERVGRAGNHKAAQMGN